MDLPIERGSGREVGLEWLRGLLEEAFLFVGGNLAFTSVVQANRLARRLAFLS